MKLTNCSLLMMSCILFGCASQGEHETATRSLVNNGSLTITKDDDGRAMMNAVPLESAMERISMNDAAGHNIAYIAFTDTDVGGMVFVDGKLLGTVSRRDAQAFYSCRGYVTTTGSYWGKNALGWGESLLSATTPAERVTLKFSGKSTAHSIKEIKRDAFESAMSIFNFSLSPVSILRKLHSANEDREAKNEYEKITNAFQSVVPGLSEAQIAEIAVPEDVEYGLKDMVLSYPTYAYEFYVSEGAVKVIQEPAFFHASRTRAALFYFPDLKWTQCTPQEWRKALPESAVVTESPSK